MYENILGCGLETAPIYYRKGYIIIMPLIHVLLTITRSHEI